MCFGGPSRKEQRAYQQGMQDGNAMGRNSRMGGSGGGVSICNTPDLTTTR